MLRFYSVPAWQLLEPKKGEATPPPEEPLRPTLEVPDDLMQQALAGVEYRGHKLYEHARETVAGKAAVTFAKPPNDLPALLRTADQLLVFSQREAGERAKVWRCECGTRYAVPASLMRPVAIKCERCGRTLDLDPARSTGESHLVDPKQAEVNGAREALSTFFREAMARGWPVLISHQDDAA